MSGDTSQPTATSSTAAIKGKKPSTKTLGSTKSLAKGPRPRKLETALLQEVVDVLGQVLSSEPIATPERITDGVSSTEASDPPISREILWKRNASRSASVRLNPNGRYV